MIRDMDYERSISVPTTPLVPVTPPRIDPYALITIGVAVRFAICIAAIWMGMAIAINGPNEGVAVIAALACGGVIYGLLGHHSS